MLHSVLQPLQAFHHWGQHPPGGEIKIKRKKKINKNERWSHDPLDQDPDTSNSTQIPSPKSLGNKTWSQIATDTVKSIRISDLIVHLNSRVSTTIEDLSGLDWCDRCHCSLKMRKSTELFGHRWRMRKRYNLRTPGQFIKGEASQISEPGTREIYCGRRIWRVVDLLWILGAEHGALVVHSFVTITRPKRNQILETHYVAPKLSRIIYLQFYAQSKSDN